MSPRSNKIRMSLLFCPMTLVIAACGGGGGSSPAAAPPTPPPAPTVVSVTPADAATEVGRSSNATATFDEDMFAITIDETSFTVEASSEPVDGAVSYDANTLVATFDPTNDLALLTTYSATLSTAITNLTGDPLASAFNWSFTTVDGNWGTSESIDSDTAADDQPRLAVNAQGTGFAVWEKATTDEIYAARYTVAGGWESEILISDTTAANPQVAVDDAGNALVVWNDTTNSEAKVVRYDVTGGWGTPALLDGGDGQGSNPKVALDSAGNGYAVWREFDGGTLRIFSVKFDPSGVLGEFDMLGEGLNLSPPDLAIDGSDTVTTVWVLFQSGPNYQVRSIRRAAGGSWGTAETIFFGLSDPAFTPLVAADDAGNVIAIWRQRISSESRDDLYANRYVAGVGWTVANAGAISTEESDVDASYDLAMDPSGNAVVVWVEADNILANRYAAGAGWGVAESIEDSAAAAGAPTVALDSQGNGLAVWQQSDALAQTIFFNRYLAGDGWEASASSIQPGVLGTTLSLPQVAVDASHEALAVWLSANPVGPVNEVSASRFQ